jgi:Fructose-bisphosphate aldolase class-I
VLLGWDYVPIMLKFSILTFHFLKLLGDSVASLSIEKELIIGVWCKWFFFPGTIGNRFQKINLENVEENRRLYRQLLFKSGKEMSQHISGVILFHETLYQKADDGTPFVKLLQDQGIIPGIKVDKGTVKLGGTDEEFTTQGQWFPIIIYSLVSQLHQMNNDQILIFV